MKYSKLQTGKSSEPGSHATGPLGKRIRNSKSLDAFPQLAKLYQEVLLSLAMFRHDRASSFAISFVSRSFSADRSTIPSKGMKT
jgi:hypothetical protein